MEYVPYNSSSVTRLSFYMTNIYKALTNMTMNFSIHFADKLVGLT